MNWPKPLLPSQDRYAQKINRDAFEEVFAWETRLDEKKTNKPEPMSRFTRIFIWVCVLSGFTLIGAAFAFYA